MREYETTVIIQPEISDEGVQAICSRLDDIVEKGNAIRLMYDDQGRRRLAYEIQNFQKGRYVMLHFLDEGGVVPVLERALRLDDSVIRFLTVQVTDEVADIEARKAEAAEEVRVREQRAEERAAREAEEAAARAEREAEEAKARAEREAEEAKARAELEAAAPEASETPEAGDETTGDPAADDASGDDTASGDDAAPSADEAASAGDASNEGEAADDEKEA
jgi:small subunit ribosomal protein S6